MTTKTIEQSPYHILLVDDDRELCALLAEYLENDGFCISMRHDGDSAINHLLAEPTASKAIDAVVLDIMMPGKSGLEILQVVREKINTPILMLTGRGDDIDRIVGLEMGADDYLGKPCNPRELSARLRAILRRTQAPASDHTQEHQATSQESSTLEAHGIILDPGTLLASVDGLELKLTSAEFNILRLLMQSCGKVLSKNFLTEEVLHRKLTAYDRSIDVHVSRIRQKLAQQADIKDVIKSIRGAGYQMIATEAL